MPGVKELLTRAEAWRTENGEKKITKCWVEASLFDHWFGAHLEELEVLKFRVERVEDMPLGHVEFLYDPFEPLELSFAGVTHVYRELVWPELATSSNTDTQPDEPTLGSFSERGPSPRVEPPSDRSTPTAERASSPGSIVYSFSST